MVEIVVGSWQGLEGGGCIVYSVYPDMIEWWMREEGKSKSQQSIRISTQKLDIRESTL